MRQIQIAPHGLWHRPHDNNGGDHTACDEPIGAVVISRDGFGNGSGLDLCPVCFTPRERSSPFLKLIQRDAMRAAQADAWFDDEDDKTDPDIDWIPNDHERE